MKHENCLVEQDILRKSRIPNRGIKCVRTSSENIVASSMQFLLFDRKEVAINLPDALRLLRLNTLMQFPLFLLSCTMLSKKMKSNIAIESS